MEASNATFQLVFNGHGDCCDTNEGVIYKIFVGLTFLFTELHHSDFHFVASPLHSIHFQLCHHLCGH